MFVFRVEGIGGQGVETATRILGRAAFISGYNIQDFFFSSRERRGSRVTGIVKMDKGTILSRQHEAADFVLILDMGLDMNEIMKDVKDGGFAIFNSKERPNIAYLKKHDIKNYHVGATDIALGIINKAIPNTVMLGALARIFNRISLKNIKKSIAIELGGDDINSKVVEEGYRGVKK